MPQSPARILVHLVFSTKNRHPLLTDRSIRGELTAYIARTLHNLGSPAIEVGVVEDHVHILSILSKTLSLSELVKEIKTGSSKWLKTKGGALQSFQWQNGYGAFSVSESSMASVREYIMSQEEHHRSLTFQEEFRRLLREHNVEFDERYVWD